MLGPLAELPASLSEAGFSLTSPVKVSMVYRTIGSRIDLRRTKVVVKVRWAMARGATRLAAATAERCRNMARAIGVERRGFEWVSSLTLGWIDVLQSCDPAEQSLAFLVMTKSLRALAAVVGQLAGGGNRQATGHDESSIDHTMILSYTYCEPALFIPE